MDRKELDANHAKLRGKAKLHEGAVTRARLRANHEAHQKRMLEERESKMAEIQEERDELRDELREEVRAELKAEMKAELEAEGREDEPSDDSDEGPPALL